MNERELLEQKGWLKKDEVPLFKKLVYKTVESNESPHVNKNNLKVRDVLANSILSGKVNIQSLPDLFDLGGSGDVLLAEHDRYGLPLRTVINSRSGLIRADPYYSTSWLNEFYSEHYRPLYSNSKNAPHVSIFEGQIHKGKKYLSFVKEHVSVADKVLEVGCGMGGILLPFKFEGFDIKGIDLGPEFVSIGNSLNLNLAVSTVDELIERGETFHLIILSHLIEHIPELGDFLNKLKSLLTTGGKMLIVVPGIHTVHTTYTGNFLLYLQNAHCWSFSRNTLTALLGKHGFCVLKSDDEIHCLVQLGEPSEKIDLSNECASLTQYLIETEKSFGDYYKQNKFVKKLSNFIKRIT